MNLVAATKPASGTSKTKEEKSHLKIEVDTKERIRVLSLITACLDLNSGETTTSVALPGAKSEIVSTTLRNNIHLGIYYPYGYQDYCSDGSNGVLGHGPDQDMAAGEILNCNVLSQGLGNDYSETPDFWPQFVQSYLPLLCETWIEVKPSGKGKGSANPSGSLTLEGIFNIM